MKIFATLLAIVVICSLLSFSQDAATAAATAACGPKEEKMKVGSQNSKNLPTEPGKAIVYVIEDDGVIHNIIGAGITEGRLDGTWVAGLNRHSPYTSLLLNPKNIIFV